MHLKQFCEILNRVYIRFEDKSYTLPTNRNFSYLLKSIAKFHPYVDGVFLYEKDSSTGQEYIYLKRVKRFLLKKTSQYILGISQRQADETICRYIIIRIYRKLRVRSIPQIRQKRLILVLDELQKRTLLLYQGLENQPTAIGKECYIKMNMRELCSITLLFHKYFYKSEPKGQKNLKKICRKFSSSSFISLTDQISPYELESIITLLHIIITEAQNIKPTDLLFQKDYSEMENILSQIQNLFQSKP